MKEFDLVCFSHLRWNFVFQRPQHLLTRFSKHRRVFYIEEPIYEADHDAYDISSPVDNISIIVPHLMNDGAANNVLSRQKHLLKQLFYDYKIEQYIFWYYTPMSLEFSNFLKPELIIYDCMDELSAFKFAPATLKNNEEELFSKADLVFTGGHSLYEAKKHRHKSIYPFPSSIDKEHFGKARLNLTDPKDQESIPHPRIGFYGVIDERFDIDLITQVASLHPAWHFVIIGPVVKIDESSLPRLNNIHYLGSKQYSQLPCYLAGWDIAMIPFALNESTKFISPTKTPEYLSGGKPVISSSIQDVVQPYGVNNLVHIADNAEAFISAVNMELDTTDRDAWLKSVDAFLSENSWDNTWAQMQLLIDDQLRQNLNKKKITNINLKEYIYV